MSCQISTKKLASWMAGCEGDKPNRISQMNLNSSLRRLSYEIFGIIILS